MKTFIRTLTLTAFLAPAVLPASGEDLAVVVNKNNPITSLTKSQLRKLVLAEQESWPAGQKVTVGLRAPGNPERDGILRSVCRMSEDDYNQHALHASFNGSSAAAPRVLGSAAAVLQFVASTPGAISFLRISDVNATVKVVSLDGVAAGQAEYKMKLDK